MTDLRRGDLDEALGFSLTDEQWDLVHAPLEPAVVVAGAGSGKTTSMSARIAWLVGSEQLAADAVLGLTFTTKAAAQLLGATRRSLAALQVKGLLPDPEDDAGDPEPQILTYNAFAARIIAEHGIRLGREPGGALLTDGAREQLAYRVVCRSTLPLARLGVKPVTLTSDLLALDGQLSELDIEPESLIDHDDDLIAFLDAQVKLQGIGDKMREAADRRRLLAQLIAEWRAEKQVRDVLDYADQTRLALAIVRGFPEVTAALRARFAAVFLDEYQDTSIAQRRLLQAVFGDGHPVMAVGDPCQGIYGWRGASVSNIEDFPRHFPALRNGTLTASTRYPLSESRRSGPAILAVANDLSASLRDRHSGVRELTASNPEVGEGEVHVGLFETAAAEKAWIVEQICAERRGIEVPGARKRWGDIAILASTAKDLVELDALLREEGVPTQLHGAAGLLRQPVVVEARAMLAVLHDPTANPDLLRVLTGPRWRIGMRDLVALGRRAAELAAAGGRRDVTAVADALDDAVAGADPVEAISLSDALVDLGDPADYSVQGYERFTAVGAEITRLRRHAGEPMTELIGRIATVTGLDVEMALSSDPAQQQAAWGSFLDLAAEFADLDGRATLGAFLTRLRDSERFDVDLTLDLVTRADAVQLLTIHKAKGLEFSHVFVPSVAEHAFPGGRARGEWPTSAAAVPWPLREDSTPQLNAFPLRTETPRGIHHDAYRAVLAELQQADHERLAYVALTRAKHVLVVTGHWWGPHQKDARGPEPYLTSIRASVERDGGERSEIVIWHPEPESDVNPSPQARAREFSWPVAIASADRTAEAAALVRAAMHGPVALPGMPAEDAGLTPQERERVADWDLQAQALLAEARFRRRQTVEVPLPASLSASAVITALRDPERMALDLARPMPQAPAPAARRGTAFHAWVESRYGQQSLIDPDELPGAGDDDIATDAQLDELKAAFERSAFAGRVPVAIEEPFALVLGGRVVRGRIDAVFEQNGRFDVIDWKTGSPKSADPYQLALYCIAWSQLREVPLTAIDAGFFMVGSGEVIRPADLPDLPTLAAELGISG